ncbi:MAG: replication protein [Ruminococcaceae bacterium]|nr:replication protein [Oscillospiraceae bacterium]
MARSEAHRKYQLTINNPLEHGLSHEVIKTTLGSFQNLAYWCMADEMGESGTYHTHLYLCSPNAIQFSTVQQRFYGAHIEPARGSHQENRDYIRKEGKWLNDVKHGTSLPNTFEESGELPAERTKGETVSEAVYGMLQDNATNAEILQCYPSVMTRLPQIEMARQTILEERYRDTFRKLHVVYLWGKSGVGKTRSIMERHGYSNVFRVTNYAHPFDGYKGQSVILFDEFRSHLPLADMLNYLDGYPLQLPCRYADKTACYTSVYIVSNIPLESQYPNIQHDEPESFCAFRRRIHEVWEMSDESADMPF